MFTLIPSRSVGKGLVAEEDKPSASAGPSASGSHSTVSPITYVQSLLDLKDKYDHFLVAAFKNDKFFKQVGNGISLMIIQIIINPFLFR